MVQTKQQSRRRAALALVAILLVVLGLGGFLAWKVFGKKLLQRVSPEAVEAVGNAMGQLRLDDAAAKERAVAALDQLVAQHSDFVDAHAARVLALALQLDDAQGRLARMEAQRKVLDEERKRATRESEQAEIDVKINALARQHGESLVPFQALTQRLEAARKDMGSAVSLGELDAATSHAVKRALTMVDAIYGKDGTIEAVARLQGDEWVELILPEYFLNVSTTADTRRGVVKSLQALTDRDTTFVRPYVLIARHRLAMGDHQGAAKALQTVVNFRKNHEIATELLAWCKELAARAQ